MSDTWNDRISPDRAASLLRLARRNGFVAGDSAVLFHDLERMRERLDTLKRVFPAHTLHAVAIKANPLVEVLRDVVAAGAGLEAASFEEVQLALAAGCPPARIVYDSPAKTRREIDDALQRGVHINADSLDELARIERAIAERPRAGGPAAPIGLRINPGVGAGSIASTSVGSLSSRFGVPLASARQEIIEAFACHPWLTGLHAHVGSQGCSLGSLVEAARTLAALAVDIDQRVGTRRVTWLDIGGGLPAVYRAEDRAPTPDEYVAALREGAPGLFSPGTRLITEMGRSIQASCGFVASRVEYVKSAPRTAVIHVGADLLLRRAYRPEDWHHDITVLDPDGNPRHGEGPAIDIAGPLCFAGDIIARQIILPPIQPGDWILVHDTGAYTLGMWSRHCSRGVPKVLGYDPAQAGSFRLLRQAESPADIVRLWSRDHAPGTRR